MLRSTRTGLALLVLMLFASSLGFWLRPGIRMADERAPVDLISMIPQAFGNWHAEEAALIQIVDPQQQELIARLYTQTLARIYVNSDGYRVMLSIAYGADQRDALQLHKPEVCYPSQGFTVLERHNWSLAAPHGTIPVTRVLTQLGQRREPLTYWTTVGDHVVRGAIDKKLAEMHYGLTDRIPDGLLVRVSSVDDDQASAYVKQAEFARQMLAALTAGHRDRLAGLPRGI